MPGLWVQAAVHGKVNLPVWSYQNMPLLRWAYMPFTCMRWLRVGGCKRGKIQTEWSAMCYSMCLFNCIFFHSLASLQLHKQQSRGELPRHTWHRQDSDESSDSVPDEVRSEPNPHSRNFPRSHTFPTTAPSPSTIPTSASATCSTTRGQEVSPTGSSQHRAGKSTAGILLVYLS